jgi:hypothetical protein
MENDWFLSSTTKIFYKNGHIFIVSESNHLKLSEISEIHLVRQKVKNYIDSCESEESHRRCVALLDILDTERYKFLKDKEFTCIRSLL